MKVGDLVQLSAYGKRVQRTSWVADGDVGILKSIKEKGYRYYEVLWALSGSYVNRTRRRWYHERFFDRRDLKMVRRKKNG